MNFTLYTYGDVYMFYNVLNAVAMVFNSSMFNPSSGAGAFLLGGLVSLIFLLFQTIAHPSSSTFRPANMMFLFLFFFAGVNIKTTVNIEDIFTGTVSSVSNIPIFLAAPAGIISAAANGLTTNVETAFNTPAPGTSFNSISLGAEGFENPLRLLMAIRCNSGSSLAEKNCPARSFPYVTRSLQLFLLYCAIPNPSFAQASFDTATNIVGYITTLSNLGGLTTYYSVASPQGVGMDCSTAATTISTDVANLFNGTNLQTMDHIVYQNMIGSEPGQTKPASWGMWGTSDVTNSFNSITNGSASQMAAQGAQTYMTNQIFMDSLNNTWKCSSSTGSINEFNTCIDGITQRDALDKMKVDDSAAGSIFAQTMFPAMNLLLMLFYGFSPLVALVAMMRMGDGSGMKVVGSYFLFGAWTQSWTPVAAIINYYMQMLAGQAAWAAGQTANGLVIQNEHMFYEALGMKIALGANMLAATPILTMALLSGSMFALTSTVSAIAGKDKVDESLAAPSLAQGNAVTQVGAHNKMNPYNTTETAGHLGTGGAMNPAFSTLSVDASHVAETNEKQAYQHNQQVTETASASIDKALMKATGKGNAYDAGRAYDETTKNTDTSTYQTAHSIVDAVTKGTGMSVQDKEALAGKLEGSLHGDANLSSVLGLAAEGAKSILSVGASVKGSLAYDHATSDTLSRQIDQNVKDSADQKTSWQHSMDQSNASGSGQHFKETLDNKLGKTESEKFGKTIAAVNSASVNAEIAESKKAAIGVGTKLNSLQLLDAAASNPEYANATRAIDQLAGDTGQSGILNNYRKRFMAQMGVSPDADAETGRRAYEVATVLAANQLPGLQQLAAKPILDTVNPGIAAGFSDNHQAIQDGRHAVTGKNEDVTGKVDRQTVGVDKHVSPAGNLDPNAAGQAGAAINKVSDGSGTYKGTTPTPAQQTEKFREEGHDVTANNLNPSGLVGTVASVVLSGDGDRSKQAGDAQDNDWGNMDNGIATSTDGPDAHEPGLGSFFE